MMNRGERGGQSWVDKVVNYISRNVINITAICYYNPLQSFSFSTLMAIGLQTALYLGMNIAFNSTPMTHNFPKTILLVRPNVALTFKCNFSLYREM